MDERVVDLMTQQLQAIRQLNESVDQLRHLLRDVSLSSTSTEQMGLLEHFSPPDRALFIYCNRQRSAGLWYTLDEHREPVALHHKAICGYLKEISLTKALRRGKPVGKLRIGLQGDRRYVLEAGEESEFTKSALACLLGLEPNKLFLPITLMPDPGESEEVMFCQIFVDNERVRSSREILPSDLKEAVVELRQRLGLPPQEDEEESGEGSGSQAPAKGTAAQIPYPGPTSLKTEATPWRPALDQFDPQEGAAAEMNADQLREQIRQLARAKGLSMQQLADWAERRYQVSPKSLNLSQLQQMYQQLQQGGYVSELELTIPSS